MDFGSLVLGEIIGFIGGLLCYAFLRYREDHAFHPLNAPRAPARPSRLGEGARRLLGIEGGAGQGPSLDDFAPVPGPEPTQQICWVCGRLKPPPNGHNPKQPDGVCRH